MARAGPPEQAEGLIQQLVAQEPRSLVALDIVASLRQRQVQLLEAGTALRELLLLRPSATHHSNLLSLMQYAEGATLASLQTYHAAWARAYAQPLSPNQPQRKRVPGRRPLRLGFVSADFGLHPTGFMVLPVLERLEKHEFQITCYSDRSDPDAWTARFRAVSDHWRRTVKLTDDALAEQIRRDEIDILFDLMGHTGHRLLVFARKPAPMQVTWFGYVGTTGLHAMDYVLADQHHVAPGEEVYYSERVLRMPHDYACYQPPGDSPDVGPLPALSNGHVTFGCLNNPAKIAPSILDCWARILGAVAGATLLLKFRGYEQEQLGERIKVEFAQRRIDPSRIRCEAGSATPEGMLAAYGRIDLALDTQPYSGGLTTCEALWMGVPVITLPGKTFAGRHATSHLTNAGFPQFVAVDVAGYVELAVTWANRLDELASLRGQMRNRLQQSALFNTHSFARDFAALLQEAWNRLPAGAVP
jgi:predicted O-linked N-acetylglucosamine transferase (SPINDLY family)